MKLDDPAWKGHKLKGWVKSKVPLKDLNFGKDVRPTKAPLGKIIVKTDPATNKKYNFKVTAIKVLVDDKDKKGFYKKVTKNALVPQLAAEELAAQKAAKAAKKAAKKAAAAKAAAKKDSRLNKFKPVDAINGNDSVLPNYPFPQGDDHIKGRVKGGKGYFKWPVELEGVWNILLHVLIVLMLLKH